MKFRFSSGPYIGIFLVSFGVMLLELGMTRLFSVSLYYHYAFLAISVTLLGLGLGGTVIFLWGEKLEGLPLPLLSLLSLLGGGSLYLTLPLFLNFPFDPVLSFKTVAFFIFLFVSFSVPFTAAGAILAYIFSKNQQKIAALYAFDLAGAALACLLCVPLINSIGGISLILGAAAIISLSAVFFSQNSMTPRYFFVTNALLIIILAITGLQVFTGFLQIKYVKGQPENPDKLFEGWNVYSRIAVYKMVKPEAHSFFEWGIDPALSLNAPEQLFMNIDAGAATPITKFEGNTETLEIFKYGLPSLPYYLLDRPKTLIIGPGGGNDVLRALVFESPAIYAVDYNPLILKVVEEEFGDFSGHPYSRPGVFFRISEGRHFVARTTEKFDLLQASLVDTFAASSSGALTLSENTLYTVEAIQEYLDHLLPGGLVSISRFSHKPAWETLRMLAIARESLLLKGQKNANECIISFEFQHFSTTLIKNEPFTAEQKQTCLEVADTLGFKPLWISGMEPVDSAYFKLMTSDDIEAFYDEYPLDVSVVTDDSPFFFFVAKPTRIFEELGSDKEHFLQYQALYLLIILLFVALIFLLLFIYLPIIVRKNVLEKSPFTYHFFYFSCLGLGYMFIEIGLIQRFLLPLGHPVYSLTVVLCTLLLGSAFGSFFAEKAGQKQIEVSYFFIGIIIFSVPMVLCQSFLKNELLSQDFIIRVVFSIVLLFPLGFVMGMPFPLGITHFFQKRAELIPWAWAINGAASVLASILAMLLAILLNYTVLFYGGMLAYVFALMILKRYRKSLIF